MAKLQLGIPREHAELFVDLLTLNGYEAAITWVPDKPASVSVNIPDDDAHVTVDMVGHRALASA